MNSIILCIKCSYYTLCRDLVCSVIINAVCLRLTSRLSRYEECRLLDSGIFSSWNSQECQDANMWSNNQLPLVWRRASAGGFLLTDLCLIPHDAPIQGVKSAGFYAAWCAVSQQTGNSCLDLGSVQETRARWEICCCFGPRTRLTCTFQHYRAQIFTYIQKYTILLRLERK